MSKLVLIIFAATLLFTSWKQAHAQEINFQFTITAPSSDSICDGEIAVLYTNSPSPLNFIGSDDYGTIISTGNSISNLCSRDFYSVELYNSNCQQYYFSCILPAFGNGTSQLDLTVNLSDTFNMGALEIHQYTGGDAPYNVIFMVNDTVYSDTLSSISNLIYNNLNGAIYYSYSFNFTDSAYNNQVGFNFNTSYEAAGSCGSYSANLWASAQGTPVSDSSLCDGTAYVEVYGGTPPYSYQFSSGSTDSTETGLCPGSYIVTITDADSNVFSSTFVIGYPNTYYFSDGGNYNYLDTLYSNAMQNCGIDYSMPIDTFYIDTAYAISNWEYVLDWTIVQDTNEFEFIETYFIDSTGYYWFGLSLYCEARTSDFGSYTFLTGALADMSITPTSVNNISKDDLISIYPNPSNGNFNLNASSKISEYSVYDQLGRKVINTPLNSKNGLVDISRFNSGIYYLVVQFEDGSIGKQKLVKK